MTCSVSGSDVVEVVEDVEEVDDDEEDAADDILACGRPTRLWMMLLLLDASKVLLEPDGGWIARAESTRKHRSAKLKPRQAGVHDRHSGLGLFSGARRPDRSRTQNFAKSHPGAFDLSSTRRGHHQLKGTRPSARRHHGRARGQHLDS